MYCIDPAFMKGRLPGMSRQLQLLCNERLQQRSTPKMAGWTAPSCAWTALWTPKGACHTKTAHHALVCDST